MSVEAYHVAITTIRNSLTICGTDSLSHVTLLNPVRFDNIERYTRILAELLSRS